MTASVPAAAFDETPPAQPEPERAPSPLCRCVDGAPTMPSGVVVGAYARTMTLQQEADERARNDVLLRGDIAAARAACERMMARIVLPRGAQAPDVRASVAELRTVATTGKRADVLAAVAKLEDALR